MDTPWVFLYDGHCRFCTAGSERMRRLTRPGVLTLRDFQQPGVLADYPQLTHDQCMRQAQLVAPDGRVFGGMEAVVRALMTRPVFGWFARLYYVPGIRWLADALYAWVAANRYRIFGRTVEGSCDSDACSVHFGAPRSSVSSSVPVPTRLPAKSIPPRA